MLTGFSGRRVAFDFGDAVLCGVLFDKILPKIIDDYDYRVNLLMLLKDIKAIGNNRLILYH